MQDYFLSMGLIGILCGLVVVPAYVAVVAGENDYPPRKTIASLVVGLSGMVLGAILLPVVIAAGTLYTIISVIKNDWIWYKR